MKLTPEQIEQFDRKGYLFFPSLFSKEELAVLEAVVPEILEVERPSLTRENDRGVVRMVKGMHLYNETIRRLTRHPRVARPAEQLLGSKVYIHQTRLNLKSGLEEQPFRGYPWHQDFSTYYRVDGMMEPRALIVAVFLDEVTACNAPLMFIPKSHRRGMITQRNREPETDAYTQIIIHPQVIRELVEEGGIVAQLGPAGSALFLHVSLAHASTENISPLRRAFYYLIYNSVENECKQLTRIEHEASADFTPIAPLSDDCLLMLQSERPE